MPATDQRFIAKGAACYHVEYDGPPMDFHFLLLPKMTMLAFTSAVEPLRVANQVTRKTLFRWFTMSEDGQPVTCSNGISLEVDSGFQESTANGVTMICSGVEPADAAGADTLNWVRRNFRHGKKIGGLCTGAYTLARAGVLKDERFTLHWENQSAFSEEFPDLSPSDNIYEIDGSFLTCGGGSAATDMMLEIIEQRHGTELATIVSDMCVHAGERRQKVPQRSAFSHAIGSRNQKLINAMQVMDRCIEDPLELEDIAEQVGLSRRQMERLFRRYLDLSPSEYYYDLRLKRADALLMETNLPITEIAYAAGFRNPGQFSRRFKARFGQSPHALKSSWQNHS